MFGGNYNYFCCDKYFSEIDLREALLFSMLLFEAMKYGVCVDLLDYNGDSYSWRVHFRNERKKTVEKVLKLVENDNFFFMFC